MSAADVCDACGCDGNCGNDAEPAHARVSRWLDRRKMAPGGIWPAAGAAVELLISDLDAGGF